MRTVKQTRFGQRTTLKTICAVRVDRQPKLSPGQIRKLKQTVLDGNDARVVTENGIGRGRERYLLNLPNRWGNELY